MKNQEMLFALIKSLNKSEKRYFKLFSSFQSGEKMYLQLFDTLDRQKKYNKKEIIAKFAHTFIAKHFSYAKNYLYYQILRSMQTYCSESTADEQLKGLLSNIAFLFEKGLYKQCEKLISKGKKLSYKYDKHLCILELIRWQIELMQIESYRGKTENDIQNIFDEIMKIHKEYGYMNALWRIYSRFMIKSIQKGFKRNQENEHILDYIQNIFQYNITNASSYHLSYYVYLLYSIYFFIQGDIQNAYYYSKKILNMMDTHSHIIKDNPNNYAKILYNTIIYQLHLKMYKEIPIYIQKLKEITTKSNQQSNLIWLHTLDLELEMFIGLGQFDYGMKQINEWDKNIIHFNKQKAITTYYVIAYTYFGTGNYSDTNQWLNKIINDTILDIRSDLYCFARLLYLISHFEKGNEEFVEYKTIHVEQYLYKRKQMYELEKVLLNFFKKELPFLFSQQDKINAFKRLKTQVEKVLQDPFEQKAIAYFDFISWIESKIEGKTFAEVVRGKVAERV